MKMKQKLSILSSSLLSPLNDRHLSQQAAAAEFV
jgi:hypothetical protein